MASDRPRQSSESSVYSGASAGEIPTIGRGHSYDFPPLIPSRSPTYSSNMDMPNTSSKCSFKSSKRGRSEDAVLTKSASFRFVPTDITCSLTISENTQRVFCEVWLCSRVADSTHSASLTDPNLVPTRARHFQRVKKTFRNPALVNEKALHAT
eukprot:4775313-Pyramimonas_sp.AAC.1